MKYNYVFVYICIIFSLNLTSFADNTSPTHKITTTTLENGIRVIVEEDHQQPAVVLNFVFHVGSIDEPRGITGISLFLEHMMFKDTLSFDQETLSQAFANASSHYDGHVNKDYTQYAFETTPDHIESIFDLQSERTMNLSLNEDNLNQEKHRLNEKQSPSIGDAEYIDEVWETIAYPSSGYQHPVQGWKEDLDNISISEVTKWYRTQYTGNNLSIIVVGDIDPKTVIELSKRYFYRLPKTNTRRPLYHEDKIALPELRAEITTKSDFPHYFIGFKLPPVLPLNELLGFEIMADILTNPFNGISSKHLIDDSHLMSDIDIRFNAFSKTNGLFVIHGTPHQNTHFYSFKGKVLQMLNQLKEDDINQRYLESLKTKIKIKHLYDQSSLKKKTARLVTLDHFNLHLNYYDQLNDTIDHISRKDLIALIDKYFLKDPKRILLSVKPND
ncbi:MAG: hypothetical protein CBD38_03510 [bacterium TMED178]|nr:MAG: hypothetical protein CBD38_03510 [bacterium TMED178]|tara:strand:- start:1607 stop:2935 length:1329 start_codon:yes stop_codon:yes gene_type:complete